MRRVKLIMRKRDAPLMRHPDMQTCVFGIPAHYSPGDDYEVVEIVHQPVDAPNRITPTSAPPAPWDEDIVYPPGTHAALWVAARKVIRDLRRVYGYDSETASDVINDLQGALGEEL